MHTKRWYQARLAKYFVDNYEPYEDAAEFYPDPADNQWLFDIPELEVRIRLTCHENGMVMEEQRMKGASRL